jgi:hypothetical protein
MKKPVENVTLKAVVPAEVWIERLGDLLKVVAAMEKDERSAAFAFLKSKFSGEWPRDDY